MSTHLFETIIVGPIHSRRLGTSLGINLLPRRGKICSFDCIYCECGWNKEHKTDKQIPTEKDIREQLTKRAQELVKEGVKVDSITFSGNGEPTLHPEFPQIIDTVIKIRNEYLPTAKISVLTNSSMLWKEGVREALMKIDNPILKIDSTIEHFVRCINRPNERYSLSETIESLKKFNGNFILQTMFLKGHAEDPLTGETVDLDCTDKKHVAGWIELVRTLKPRQIMMYTLDRDTPLQGLKKVTVEEMKEIAQPLLKEGFKITVNGTPFPKERE